MLFLPLTFSKLQKKVDAHTHHDKVMSFLIRQWNSIMDHTKWTSNKFLRYTLIIIIAGVIISYFSENHTFAAAEKKPLPKFAHKNISLPADKARKIIAPNTFLLTKTLTVRQGDILAVLFHRAGLPTSLWIEILKLPLAIKYLDHLQIGHTLQIQTNTSHEFVSLTYSIDLARSLHIQRYGKHLFAKIIKQPVTKALRFKSSVIHRSLYQAEIAAGLPLDLQHELNAMFASSHITHDVHPGERLEVLYHEYFVNDHADRPGNIVAAEITNGKNHYRVVRYTMPNHQTGYYKPDGEGTLPAFLRVPLHYERIGSRFSYHRFDPVEHRVQPHLGVDFDAPMGTPVHALGNGVIVFCKQMRGYGNVVMVRYNKTYKSFYAHLEKFARHLHPNEPVKKGQVIGYVGMTGWSTGPHLHFAVYKNGVAVNPLTVKFPYESPIPERYRHAFFNQENYWFNEMKLFEQAKVAKR